VLPRSLPEVIVIVTGNFGNHDNIYGYLPTSGEIGLHSAHFEASRRASGLSSSGDL
jgi:hypothetical protein